MNNQTSKIITNNYLRVTKKYFDEVAHPVFCEISKSIKPITKTYIIADKIICLKFYSVALAERISKALSHVQEDIKITPDLTVCLWDSVSTDTHILPLWGNNIDGYTYKQEANAKIKNLDRFLGLYLPGEETLNLYDEKDNIAYFWTYDANYLPPHICASPLRSIFNWFFSKNGIHLIHGAVVGMNGKSILITGKGGAGKSTTALSCLLSGMEYLGDDYVIIKYNDIITTHSVFNSVKVFPHSLEDIFPELREKVWNKIDNKISDPKAVVFLSDLFPNQIIKTAPLCAIMVPIIKDIKETRIIPASKLQTILAMIPTTLFQLSLTDYNKIVEIKDIIERTPCYFLELGSNIRDVPKAIKSFLSDEE